MTGGASIVSNALLCILNHALIQTNIVQFFPYHLSEFGNQIYSHQFHADSILEKEIVNFFY